MGIALAHLSCSYAEGLRRQAELVALVSQDGLPRALALTHPPTFTFGRHAKKEHLLLSAEALQRRGVDVVATDRGGEVTYHGPGQLVLYPIVDLRRFGLRTIDWVRILEQAMCAVLLGHGVVARRLAKAPGVYVGPAKIGFIGLRIQEHISTHGLALNLGGDLTPFSWMNPCGFEGLAVTSIERLCGAAPCPEEAAGRLMDTIDRLLLARRHENSRVSGEGTI